MQMIRFVIVIEKPTKDKWYFPRKIRSWKQIYSLFFVNRYFNYNALVQWCVRFSIFYWLYAYIVVYLSLWFIMLHNNTLAMSVSNLNALLFSLWWK